MMKKNNKAYVILLFLLMALITGFVAIFFRENISFKKKWQTYTNSRFNFSLEYPLEWTLGTAPENNDGREFISPEGETNCRAYGFFNTVISKDGDPQNLEEYADWTALVNTAEALEKETTQMAGLEAMRMVSKSDDGKISETVYILDDEAGWALSCDSTSLEKRNKFKKDFNRMVKSFKRTDNQVSRYSGWQVFQSSQHKLKFRFPKLWQLIPETERENLLTGLLRRNDEAQDKVKIWTGEMATPVYQIAFRVDDNPENLTAQDFELRRYLPGAREKISQDQEEFNIKGVEGFKKTVPSSPSSSGLATVVSLSPQNGKIYTFTYSADAHKDTHEKYLAEFFEILESLEFGE